jgi:hypothetical protein
MKAGAEVFTSAGLKLNISQGLSNAPKTLLVLSATMLCLHTSHLVTDFWNKLYLTHSSRLQQLRAMLSTQHWPSI